MKFTTRLLCTILFLKGGLVRKDTVIMPNTLHLIGFFFFWHKVIILLFIISWDIMKKIYASY